MISLIFRLKPKDDCPPYMSNSEEYLLAGSSRPNLSPDRRDLRPENESMTWVGLTTHGQPRLTMGGQPYPLLPTDIRFLSLRFYYPYPNPDPFLKTMQRLYLVHRATGPLGLSCAPRVPLSPCQHGPSGSFRLRRAGMSPPNPPPAVVIFYLCLKNRPRAPCARPAEMPV